MRIDEINTIAENDLVWDLIWKMVEECQIALKTMKVANKFLYRVMAMPTTHSPVAAKLSSPINRKPRDIAGPIQEIIDSVFKEHGFTALRHNSIFTVPNLKEAAAYANLDNEIYIIIPTDKASYTWSPVIGDLFSMFNDSYSKYNFQSWLNETHKEFLTSDHAEWSELIKEYATYLVQYYEKGKLFSALKANSEILVNGDYYAFSLGRHDVYKKRLHRLLDEIIL